jgi:uncharacterized GH25 family protein
MKITKVFGIFLLLMAIYSPILSGCGSTDTTTAPQPTPIPTPIPTPKPDTSTITGRVISPDGSPIKNTVVRLANVYRQNEDGAYVLDSANSPAAFTDSNGIFVFNDTQAGEFVFVVGDPMSKYDVIADEAGQARTWLAEANQIVDWGQIITNYKP